MALSGEDIRALVAGIEDAVYHEGLSVVSPSHTLYGGAHLFSRAVPAKLGRLALASMERFGGDARSFAEVVAPDLHGVTEIDRWFERVRAKLSREPVEDLRVDFEDGYGARADSDEREHAATVGRELAAAAHEGLLPRSFGVRVKALTTETGSRGLRTLSTVFEQLCGQGGQSAAERLIVTLPKVTHESQVATLHRALTLLERRCGLRSLSVRVDLMIEDPEALVAADGSLRLRRLIDAGEGRVTSCAFGTYDFVASLGVDAAAARHRHVHCDVARSLMAIQLAGTRVSWSDGVTTMLPVPPHRGPALTERQQSANREAVHAAWRLHADNVRHSVSLGFYQGWDLHPAQLPARFGALFAYYLGHLDPACERLRTFADGAAQASLSGTTFDDAASVLGLVNFGRRGLRAGALTREDFETRGVDLKLLARLGFDFLEVPTP